MINKEINELRMKWTILRGSNSGYEKPQKKE
jgi:hypothetical protein